MLPVNVAITRTPAPGRGDDLVAWAEGIATEARVFPGHQEARVFRSGSEADADVIVAFTFASAADLQSWESSPQRATWSKRLEGLVTGEATTHTVSGFEGIFAHPGGQPVYPPPRWKTAAIIALALYPVSLLLAWLLGPLLASWPLPLRQLLTVAIIVPYMAWVGVPYLTRWLRGWLHPARD